MFTNDGPYLQQCKATSPSMTTSSSRALYEVSSGISAEIHRILVKIWASRIAFRPE